MMFLIYEEEIPEEEDDDDDDDEDVVDIDAEGRVLVIFKAIAFMGFVSMTN